MRVLVVWEPVIDTDRGPPDERARRPLADPRAVEFWDPGRALSEEILAALRRDPGMLPAADRAALLDEGVAWDVVALYPPGARWHDGPAPAVFWGGPVIRAIGSLDSRLRER